MTGWLRSARVQIILAVALLIALVVTCPLRLAFSLFGLADMGVAARSVRGPIWWGGAEELQIRGVRLGTVNMALNPAQLLIGRVRIEIMRHVGSPDDISGAFTIGWGQRGIDDVTGALALAASLAPLPVSRVELEGVSVHFAGGRCTLAEGRVRARVPAFISGLSLANGLAGGLSCAGEAVELSLASQSGQERLIMRIGADGGYEATMRIKTTDSLLGAALAANGFRAVGDEQILRTVGRL